jgi:hypothetical protein
MFILKEEGNIAMNFIMLLIYIRNVVFRGEM